MRVVLDSSVIVAALRPSEPRHQEAKWILAAVGNGVLSAIEPLTVLVEVAAAIRRRTNSQELADSVLDSLTTSPIHFLEMDRGLAMRAAKLATMVGVRGMDAIVIQTARDYLAKLLSFDEEMLRRLPADVQKADAMGIQEELAGS